MGTTFSSSIPHNDQFLVLIEIEELKRKELAPRPTIVQPIQPIVSFTTVLDGHDQFRRPCEISAAIHGGDIAREGEFPNSVAILRDGEVFGGGVLVSPIHVFTSCQNIGYFMPPKVTVYYRNRTKDFRPHSLDNLTLVAGTRWIYSLEGGQSEGAADSYPHPSCVDTIYGFWKHDTGVIETSTMFDFKKNLHAVYFWTNDRRVWGSALDEIIETRSNCTVMGWGKTKGRNFSEWLLVTTVGLVPPTFCVYLLCLFFPGGCGLNDKEFSDSGKVCAHNFQSSGPSTGDVGNALYCNGYFYGLITSFSNISIGTYFGITIFDRVDYSFDLYRAVVREAQEHEGIYFPFFKTIIANSSNDVTTKALNGVWQLVLLAIATLMTRITSSS